MAVYFIQDSNTCHIKIGYTSGDPAERMAALQTGNPGKLVLLCHFEPADQAYENTLHRRFAADRVQGEWFRPSAALIQWLCERVSRCASEEAEVDRYVNDALHYDMGYRHGMSAGIQIGRRTTLDDCALPQNT